MRKKIKRGKTISYVYLEVFRAAEKLGIRRKEQKWAFYYFASLAVHEESGKVTLSFGHGAKYEITVEGKLLSFSAEVLRKTAEKLEKHGLISRSKGYCFQNQVHKNGEINLSALRDFLGKIEIPTPTRDWTVQVYLDGEMVAASRKKGILKEFWEYGNCYREILKQNRIEFSQDLRAVYEECATEEQIDRLEQRWKRDFQPAPINIHLHKLGNKEFGYGRLHCRTNSIRRWRKGFLSINGDNALWEIDIKHSVPQIILITKGAYRRGQDVYRTLVEALQSKGYAVTRETIKKTLLIFQNSPDEQKARRGIYRHVTTSNGFTHEEAQETRRAVQDGSFLQTVQDHFPALRKALLNKTEQDRVLFLEARIILGTMKALWERGIPSIYRYDALILPLPQGKLTRVLVEKIFHEKARRALGTELDFSFSPIEKYRFRKQEEQEQETKAASLRLRLLGSLAGEAGQEEN